jgi:hypothetical protein
MALVRRRRGDAVLLPSGVVARMQFTPYRVQLAGIQTAVATFRPLVQQHRLLGRVIAKEEFGAEVAPPPAGTARGGEGLPVAGGLAVACSVWESDRAWVVAAGEAQVVCEDLPGQPTATGQWTGPLAGATGVWGLRLLDPPPGLAPGMLVSVRCSRALADCPPFDSQPRPVPELMAGEPRELFACADHPHVMRAAPGTCPLDGEPLLVQPLRPCERVRWWCPIHREARSDRGGQRCPHCRAKLAPRVERYVPAGCVLCVPEGAVLDTGEQQLVYVERHPGMVDGVLVEAGPAVGGWVPIVRGLNEGERVVAAAAFLVDAEARLNPALAASYFGASGTWRAEEGQATGAGAVSAAGKLADLAPPEAEAAARQGICPVTGLALGSMGKPLAVDVLGVRVWICCAGCASALRKHPHEHMARLP